MHHESLEFQYPNGKHGVRLIKLPMSWSNNGRVTPNIKKCIEELLSAIGSDDDAAAQENAFDIILDYLVNDEVLLEMMNSISWRPNYLD